MLRQRDIRRRFDRAAADFDNADFVHAVTREGLIARLEPLRIDAASVLDLGAATGATGRALRKRFRRAHIVSMDISAAMSQLARSRKSWFSRASFVQGDAGKLPFADASFDLVVANQLLPWLSDLQPAFAEVARILKKGGVFAFASLGPDSLREIVTAWSRADALFGAEGPIQHVNSFPDMHDVGDALVKAGLSDPVLDVDRLTVEYEHVSKLFDDLTRAGARNALANRFKGLTGKDRFRAMAEALENANSGPGLSLELELVYGHCWGSGRPSEPADYHFAADKIPLRR